MATATKRAKKSSKSTSKRVSSQKASRTKLSPENEQTFYKVFSTETIKDKEVLVSPSIKGVFKLHYFLNKRTKANEEMLKIGYGIMIFSTKEEASGWRDSIIKKVKVGKVFECPERRLHQDTLRYTSESRGKEVKLFTKESKASWKTIVSRLLKSLDVVNSWPSGSLMTDWIIPIEDEVNENA